MVTMEQVKAGLMAYIDAEILPRMEGYRRYGLTVYLALLMDNFSGKLMDALNRPAIAALGVMDESGRIDIEKVHNAAYSAMREDVDVSIPVVGRFVFSRADVDKLCEMIRRS